MKLLIIILFILATGMLKAQPVPDSPPNEHELQIGLATVVSDSIYTGGKTQYKVFPAVDYQYKRFYFQAGDMGFNMIDTDDWEVNFGLGVDLVGDLERGDSRIFSDLPDLSYPVNTFLSARYKSPIGLFKVKHNYEVNNKHNGQSSSLSYAAPIFKGKWLIMPQLSYNHYSSEVVNYFFGVDPLDASDSLPSYQSGAVNSYEISVLALFEINKKWSLVGNLQNEHFGDGIANSPLTEDDQRLSFFAGFLYKIF